MSATASQITGVSIVYLFSAKLPTQRVGNAEDVSIWWRHHNIPKVMHVVCALSFLVWSGSHRFYPYPSRLHHWHQGRYSLRIHRLVGIGIPIINLRRLSDRLRFIMRIAIPVRLCFLMNRVPEKSHWFSASHTNLMNMYNSIASIQYELIRFITVIEIFIFA